MDRMKIGIVGGGQLGKMMILEGKKLGLSFAILDPTEDCPASSIADEHIVKDFYDRDAIRELAKITDVLTYEFEDINAEVLMDLENEGYKIYPSPETLHIIQNKFNQKTFLDKHNLPVGDFEKINTLDELYKISDIYGFPLLLKSCRGGYDGKGNYFIKGREDIPLAYEELGGGKSQLMAEIYIDFKKEVSVIAARGMSGEIRTYPLVENIHENNILKTTIVPARVSEEIVKK
ncbi:MAG: ATP-grasp domain-containing protein, partial [Clostridiales bacterium]|nr:ATP-grasp domain-containing protein [Clostridiales bacterium]